MVVNREIVRMTAYLPVKLAVLAELEPQLALEVMKHWGNGTKPLVELWDLVSEKTDKLVPRYPASY